MDENNFSPSNFKNKCMQCDLIKLHNLVGKKWSVELFHYITNEPVSFNELWRLNDRLASPILISRRLKELQEFKLIKKEKINKRLVYTITKEGQGLKNVLHLLKKWGIENNYNLPSGCKDHINGNSK
ncbi:MAG: winged helix-turn-helix transcriptional regulator [Candidatus Nanoarchaeia archaeon]